MRLFRRFWIVVVMAAVCAASCMLAACNWQQVSYVSHDSNTPTASPQITIAPTASPQITKNPQEYLPEVFDNMFYDVGKEADTIFLAVQTTGTSCVFDAYVREGDTWQSVMNCQGYLGRNGISYEGRREGDGTTPGGVFAFGLCFGIKDAPGDMTLAYTKVKEDMYWDGDSRSLYYNSLVRGNEMPDVWSASASEHLIEYGEPYNYCSFIRYNDDPVVAGAGSAIFLHCTTRGASSSAGCVAIPEEYMIRALNMMTDRTCIVIVRDKEDIATVCQGVNPFESHTNDNLPEGFTYVADYAPNIVTDIRYYGDDNFLGRRAAGYEANVAISTVEAAEALRRAAELLFHDGYRLVVYDIYRPVSAVEDFIAWSKDFEDDIMKEKYYPSYSKEALFELQYIAARSRHSRGSAVDVSIVKYDGTPVDMGGHFDLFDNISHHDATGLSNEASANRAYLRSIMEQAGFGAINNEWWHYYLVNEPFPNTYFDFPVS